MQDEIIINNVKIRRLGYGRYHVLSKSTNKIYFIDIPNQIHAGCPAYYHKGKCPHWTACLEDYEQNIINKRNLYKYQQCKLDILCEDFTEDEIDELIKQNKIIIKQGEVIIL